MFGITVPALTSAARTLAGYLAVWLVAKGLIVDADIENVVALITTAVGIGASVYFRRTSAIVEQAANLPEVKTITVTTKAVADEAPANVVKG